MDRIVSIKNRLQDDYKSSAELLSKSNQLSKDIKFNTLLKDNFEKKFYDQSSNFVTEVRNHNEHMYNFGNDVYHNMYRVKGVNFNPPENENIPTLKINELGMIFPEGDNSRIHKFNRQFIKNIKDDQGVFTVYKNIAVSEFLAELYPPLVRHCQIDHKYTDTMTERELQAKKN
jgi:hypothetical protein